MMNGDDQNAATSMEIERKIDKVLLQNSRESEVIFDCLIQLVDIVLLFYCQLNPP